MKNSKKSVLFAATAMSMAYAVPSFAQDAQEADEATAGNDIIVTARRIEEKLQDVPISITVLSEKTLANNNINSAKDIATYTPGLTTNNRYGGDSTTWTIRGFTQELRTTTTVGTYFADVVAPRGSGATQGGDGAGAGSLFDLQNVQVLKGPQGTLFGRNSTGGAVLLVPRKPVDRLEGYLEGSAGGYNMWRVQGVVNLPVSDSFRLRVGVDHNQRDGYLKNIGRFGFGPYGKDGGSINYTALRLSAVLDVTPDIENYTVGSYSKSKSTGVIPKLVRCFPGVTQPLGAGDRVPMGDLACQQMAREAATGNFWTVSNILPDSLAVNEQWQVINTTTFKVSDSLTVKNIFSYGEFRGNSNLELFGTYWPITVAADQVTSPTQVLGFVATHDNTLVGYTNAQSSLVEELQFQGSSGDDRFVWQAGLYLEINNPLGKSGTQSINFTPCTNQATFNCVPGGTTFTGTVAGNAVTGMTYSAGSGMSSLAENYFRGKAIYAQASYAFTDQLKLTGGIRYTWDTMRSKFQVITLGLGSITSPAQTARCNNTLVFGGAGSPTTATLRGNPLVPIDQRGNICQEEHKVDTSAPTWLIGLDFKPTEDILLYAKYSRGYRQGGVASFGADKLQDFKKEVVNTYEIGAKTSWRGAVPGYFNISGFYNDFRDQQLQIGLFCSNTPGKATGQCGGQTATAILNAGRSRLQGFEAELGLSPFEGMRLEAAYAYLNTRVQEILNVSSLAQDVGLDFDVVRGVPVGAEINYAMPHKLTMSANYTLPLSESIGKVTIGGTFVYQSKYRVTAETTGTINGVFQYTNTFGVVPGSKMINLNVNWENVGGMPLDAAFFMTNVNNAKVYLHVNVQDTRGFLSSPIGEPRMWGFRLKYRFGN